MAGLRWLAGVGASPYEAWGVAMGWAPATAFSHGARLVGAGLAGSCRTRHGHGSLLYATHAGVEAAGVLAVAFPRQPAPTSWAHLEACAWTAAWMTARGRHVIGERELLTDRSWRGELEWLERDGLRRRGHRPDLLAGLTADGPVLPVEVELASKSLKRLRAIMALHASWIAARKTTAVIYVCGPSKLADRVRREGADFGLEVARKTLRVELLDSVRNAARAARADGLHEPPSVVTRAVS